MRTSLSRDVSPLAHEIIGAQPKDCGSLGEYIQQEVNVMQFAFVQSQKLKCWKKMALVGVAKRPFMSLILFVGYSMSVIVWTIISSSYCLLLQ